MERRDFITAVGATAAIASVSQALANEHEKHPTAAGEHHHPPKYKALQMPVESMTLKAITAYDIVLGCYP